MPHQHKKQTKKQNTTKKHTRQVSKDKQKEKEELSNQIEKQETNDSNDSNDSNKSNETYEISNSNNKIDNQSNEKENKNEIKEKKEDKNNKTFKNQIQLLKEVRGKLESVVWQYDEYIDYNQETKRLFTKQPDKTVDFENLSKKESDFIYNRLKEDEESFYDRILYLSEMNAELLDRFNFIYNDIHALHEEIKTKLETSKQSNKNLQEMMEKSINRLLEITKIKTDSDIKFYREQIKNKEEFLKEFQQDMSKLRERNTKLSQTDNCDEIQKDIIDDMYRIPLENWSQKKISNVIFDTNYDDYYQNTSVFDTEMMKKKDVAILIETTIDNEKIVAGMCIFEEINKLYTEPGTTIFDDNAFIFTFRKDKQLKFSDKKQMHPFAINLYSKESEVLFQLGMDVKVSKELSILCLQNDQSVFDYGKEENALFGKVGKDIAVADRIVVYQLE